MCTKICNWKYRLEDAAVILEEQFTYVNIQQMTLIYSHHQHIEYSEILQKIKKYLLFYIIQYISEDNRIIKITIVSNSRTTNTRRINTELKEIGKENSKGKYKLYIFIQKGGNLCKYFHGYKEII